MQSPVLHNALHPNWRTDFYRCTPLLNVTKDNNDVQTMDVAYKPRLSLKMCFMTCFWILTNVAISDAVTGKTTENNFNFFAR